MPRPPAWSASRRTGAPRQWPALAAKIYGLDVLASDIADHPDNETGSWSWPGQGAAATGHDKTTIVVFQRSDQAGSLLAILQEFAARAINLTKLESVHKEALGDYCFIIDFEGHWATSSCTTAYGTCGQGGRRQVPRQLSGGRRARPGGAAGGRSGLARGRRVDRHPATKLLP